jgi:3'-5' exoribonuclease
MSVGSTRTAEKMEQDLRQLIGTVQSPHLAALLQRIFGPETATWEAFQVAPAAKHYHQAYDHGLLEHTVTVAQAVSALSAIFPGLDRDLALTGALVHDIGKLDTYARVEDRIEMTDVGRLHGEIVLGYQRIRREIDHVLGFPQELAQALLHIVLSHHGSLEHGSPVVPCTREATLVHMADNLGSKLGSFDRIERGLELGSQWSGDERGIGASAYFGSDGAEPSRTDLAA